MNPLHHELPSGRVLFLTVPLTDEELAEANTPAGIELLEALADAIAERATTSIGEGDPLYDEMKKRHGL